MNLDLFRYDYRVVETYFLKSIRSNQNEDHFYGVWNHRLLMATSKHSEDVDSAALFLSGILSNFVTKWRQVINNQSEMIYSFDKNPILYLIKMTMIVGSFEMIDPANELITKQLSSVMKKGKRGTWNAQSYCKSKVPLPITLYQSWCYIFIFTLKYLPTIIAAIVLLLQIAILLLLLNPKTNVPIATRSTILRTWYWG